MSTAAAAAAIAAAASIPLIGGVCRKDLLVTGMQSITGGPEDLLTSLLEQHSWNLSAAVIAFYEEQPATSLKRKAFSPAEGAENPLPQKKRRHGERLGAGSSRGVRLLALQRMVPELSSNECKVYLDAYDGDIVRAAQAAAIGTLPMSTADDKKEEGMKKVKEDEEQEQEQDKVGVPVLKEAPVRSSAPENPRLWEPRHVMDMVRNLGFPHIARRFCDTPGRLLIILSMSDVYRIVGHGSSACSIIWGAVKNLRQLASSLPHVAARHSLPSPCIAQEDKKKRWRSQMQPNVEVVNLVSSSDEEEQEQEQEEEQKQEQEEQKQEQEEEEAGDDSFVLATLMCDGLSLIRGKGLNVGEPLVFRQTGRHESRTKNGKPLTKKQRASAKNDQQILRFATASQPVNSLPVGRISSPIVPFLTKLHDAGYLTLSGRVCTSPPKLNYFSPLTVEMTITIHASLFTAKKKEQAKAAQAARQLGIDTSTLQVAASTDLAFLSTAERRQHESGIVPFFLRLLVALALRPVTSTHDNCASLLKENGGQQEETEEQAAAKAAVSRFQLSSIYHSAQQGHLALPERMEPVDKLHCTLLPYQRQALHWMTGREEQKEGNREKGRARRHPLWDEYRFADGRTSFFVNAFSNEISLSFPEAKAGAKGGILADEMGLGKTVQTIALFVTLPPDRVAIARQNRANQHKAGRPVAACTLVVAPMTLIGQWFDEVEKHSKHLKPMLYYGTDRALSLSALVANKTDVVITSYGVLVSEYKKHVKGETPSALFSCEWHRVVLDEAHYIRNRSTEQAVAAFAIEAQRRWLLTGTPIQNTLNDVFALLHFLRDEPWCNIAWWNQIISRPFAAGDQTALGRLKALLQPLMLRRTKDMRNASTGLPIVNLPPRIETTIELEFSAEEKDFYNALFSRTKTSFDTFVARGVLLNHYIQVLTLVLRLRQACDHPFLVLHGREAKKDGSEDDKQYEKLIQKFILRFKRQSLRRLQAKDDQRVAFSDDEGDDDGLTFPSQAFIETSLPEVLRGLRKGQGEEGAEECILCLDTPEAPCFTECGHMFCRACIEPVFNSQGNALCPICRARVSRNNLTLAPGVSPPGTDDRRLVIKANEHFQDSSKTSCLLHELAHIPQGTKAVVFSQWTSMLDIIERSIANAGAPFQYVRLDGASSQKQRTCLIQKFSEDASITVMLISLRAGGVGLNLTAASNVFFMDCWWNGSVEDQAIQRCHRIGQTQPVIVKRFVMKGSIEERVIQRQKSKQELAQAVGMSARESRTIRMDQLMRLQLCVCGGLLKVGIEREGVVVSVVLSHDAAFLVFTHPLLEEVGLALKRDHLHPLKGVECLEKLGVAECDKQAVCHKLNVLCHKCGVHSDE